ncbi:MAG TPA: DUF1570 domain-containing protein [Isosphaeraceae bacterium]|nr:DUF1570 domain-containing protein [Isosphaeraceae bacterium]
MAFVVARCDGCGVRMRTARPDYARTKTCPRCNAPLESAIARALGETGEPVLLELCEPSPPEPSPIQPAVAELVEMQLAEPERQEPAGWFIDRRALLQWVSTSALLIAAVAAINLWLLPGRSARSPGQVAIAATPTSATASIPECAGGQNEVVDEGTTDRAPPPAPEPAAIGNGAPPPPRPGTFSSRSLPPPPLPSSAPTPAPEILLDSASQGLRPLAPVSPPQSRSILRDRSAPPPQPEPALLSPRHALPKGSGPDRVLVRGDDGRPMVTRVYGEQDGELVVLLPDGELGCPDGRAFTDLSFKAMTRDELADALHQSEYGDFQVRKTSHYVIFYRCSEAFATDSAKLLESLYLGLFQTLSEWQLDLREAEFPLVAVIYDTERAFRAHNQVDRDVQAFYQIFSNRIFFYEHSERDETSPEVAAIRKPQTIAHEGTHQILLNIGVQPRLARWPIWLVEGLAEYCAPTYTKRGAEWAGVGKPNPLHMATIHDLEDQAALQRVRGMSATHITLGKPSRPLVEHLVTAEELKPIEYASVWALTHYLATKHADEFQSYLKTMSQMRPLANTSPEEHLEAFRAAFGSDLVKLDKAWHKYLFSLKCESLPYYAVMFEQQIQGGGVRKAALVSQSPSMIRQWVETIGHPHGLPPAWSFVAYPTRVRATIFAEEWIKMR